MSKAKIHQWQLYNPLDKSNVAPEPQKSNKLPYTKDEVSADVLLEPKITTVGVLPVRKSSDIKNLDVMLVGGSLMSCVNSDVLRKSDKERKQVGNPILATVQTQHQRKKMPAIVSSEGTTTQASFSARSKPPSMPRSNIKQRKKPVMLLDKQKFTTGNTTGERQDTGKQKSELALCFF